MQLVNILLAVYFTCGLAFVPDHALRQPWSLRDVLGAATGLSGLSLRWWSQRELGSMFTFEVGIRKDHRLVESGPYAVLRHPSYTGLLLGIVGIAVFLRFAAVLLTHTCLPRFK